MGLTRAKKKKNPAAVALGRLYAKRVPARVRRRIARQGAQARWGKPKP